jgi:membrane protein YqaA with SNARE-associated domain
MLSALVATLRTWADGAGGPGVLALAALDSSFLALPNATDALVMYLSIQRPSLWWYYAGMALAGTLAGSWPLYLLGRKGGEAAVARRFGGPRGSAAVAAYRRSAFLAILIPAFLPPPVPVKIFIVLAGATALPLWQGAAALALGRGARVFGEALLAAAYRDEALAAFEDHGLTLGLVALGVVTLAGVLGLAWTRTRPVGDA